MPDPSDRRVSGAIGMIAILAEGCRGLEDLRIEEIDRGGPVAGGQLSNDRIVLARLNRHALDVGGGDLVGTQMHPYPVVEDLRRGPRQGSQPRVP